MPITNDMKLYTDDDLGGLIGPIERAVKTDRTVTLAGVLAGLYDKGVLVQDLFAPPNPDHYVRRLIWRDPEDRFVAIAITWAPGQGSPLHDHGGLWGAEIVVDGAMSETIFELLDKDGSSRCRFRRGKHRECREGTVGVLVPPRDYHEFGNSRDAVAHTFHVYGGDLKTARTFTEGEDGWWTARPVELHYDA
jgi:3-mercaptopropionate dioxygenase